MLDPDDSTTLVRRYGQAATIVMGDLNVAASAADRSSGKLEHYDEGRSPWSSLCGAWAFQPYRLP